MPKHNRSLAEQASNLVGKNWSKASLTKQKNLGNMKRFANRIEAKFGLENIQNLKPGHISSVFKDMIKEGMSPSALSGYATVARTVATAIGKQNIVPRTNKELGFTRAGTRLQPQSLSPDVDHVRELLYQKAEYLGLAHDMRAFFGLRAKESLMTSKIMEKEERLLLQVEGAKGGRPREIEIKTEQQLKIVERVQQHIQETGGKSLIPPELTLKQGYDQQRNTLRAIGATRANSTNSHALRHDYVQRRSSEISNQRLAAEIGHNRKEILRHYRG